MVIRYSRTSIVKSQIWPSRDALYVECLLVHVAIDTGL